MSQSWDNVSSMHDHLLTVHGHKTETQTAVPCACADGSGCRGHTPHSKQFQLSVQWRRSRSTGTLLPDYWQVWQRTDLASHFARGSVASASACLAGFSKRTVLSRRSFDNASLAVAMARGIKATLLCAHGPTVLTNPQPCSVEFLSAHAARS